MTDQKQAFTLHPGESIPEANLYALLAGRNREIPWRVTVEKYRKNRSAEQNAYYWGVVLPTIQAFILEHRGDNYSCDDLHEWFRDEFLPHRVVMVKGKEKVVRPSTASLKVDEFGEYLEKVIWYASQGGIAIPEAQ